ncbi:MAG: ABC transporter ATP-binding protein [Candidatus Bathyarchaeia archaeon]
MYIDIRNLSVTYKSPRGDVEALKDINIGIEKGSFISVIGPSGCGKSTLLKVIAGLVKPTSGEVWIDGRKLEGIPQNIGFVFQEDTLLPWRNVLGNVEIGLEIRGVKKEKRRKRALELIKMAGLNGFEHKMPYELSGGMRQRVALIRTLAYDPEIILMDEPFGALDAQTRIILQDELLKIWQETKKTIIFVTHDLAEAITLSEIVIILTARPGTIKRIYEVPIPYPRFALDVRSSSEFTEVFNVLWKDLREEVMKVKAH